MPAACWAVKRLSPPGLACADELRASQGQGLVAAMREVPAEFFQEGFDLDQQRLWEELVQVGAARVAAHRMRVLALPGLLAPAAGAQRMRSLAALLPFC